MRKTLHALLARANLQIAAILCISFHLSAASGPGIFNQYPNLVFVETGTWVGESTEEAIRAGFQEIHSIELSKEWHAYCQDKFKGMSNVHLWQGDSGAVLEEVIRNIQVPITFWLDAHYSGEPTAKGNSFTPILQELEAIKKHPIKTHTILIDDIRIFGTEDFDFIPLSQVLELLHEINPDYKISYRNGFVRNDILVAKIPK